MHVAAERSVQPQRPERVDDRREPGLVAAHEEERLEMLRRRHQPHRHPGDDAEVRLREQAVEGRPDAPAAERRRTGARKPAESRFEALAVRQHHLVPARIRAVVAHGRVAEAALEGVADHAAIGAGARGVHPEPGTALLEVGVQLALGHTGLDRHVGQLLVERDDAVHAAEIDEHAVARGNARPVAPVLAGAERVERHAVPVRYPDDLLNVIPIPRAENRKDA